MESKAERVGRSIDSKTLTTALIQAMGNHRHRHNKVGEYWVQRFDAECRVLGVPELPGYLYPESYTIPEIFDEARVQGWQERSLDSLIHCVGRGGRE